MNYKQQTLAYAGLSVSRDVKKGRENKARAIWRMGGGGVHSGQTSEICQNWAKYFKVKVTTFIIESLRYYQHPVSLLNVFKVY